MRLRLLFVPLVSFLVDNHSKSKSKVDAGIKPKSCKNYRKIPLNVY